MTCPACSQAVPAGQERCPACGRVVAPAVEGSLAPQPHPVTPPSPGTPEPLRDIPGLRRRERSWKDEVRDRVRQRRQDRSPGTDLPLFPDDQPAASPQAETDAADALDDPESRAAAVITQRVAPAAPPEPRREVGLDLGLVDDEPDLPLRPVPEEPTTEGPRLRDVPLRDDDASLRSAVEELDDWSPPAPRDEPRTIAEPRPLERPARLTERLQAAVLDFGVLLGLWALVVYSAARAAHVEIARLRPVWPYLVGYLGFLGVVYAGYFTATTGRTLGKMICGLRVVDRAGRHPGFLRAALRAALGTLGTIAGGAGLVPMLFDPARRAAHDRLFRTRVVKS